MTPIIGLTLAGALVAYAAPAFAQDAAPAAVDEGNFGEILVTAQRRSENLRDVPITITAATGEDLARAGITSSKELTIAVPGLSFTTQGAWAQPNIRGVSTFASGVGAESPIAIYVDGVYYVNQVGSVFDMPDVERVEVLKGPQGTLFGRNATGGAISIHTKNPSLTEANGKLTLQDGMYLGSDKDSQEIVARAFVSTPLSDKLAVSISGNYSWTDGYLTNDSPYGIYGKRAGRREAYQVRAKMLFQPTETVKFLLSGFYGHDNDRINSSMTAINGVTSANGQVSDGAGGFTAAWPGGIVANKKWHISGEFGGSLIKTKSKGASLKADFEFPGAGTLTSLTSYLYVSAHPTVDVDAAYSPTCLAFFACISYDVISGPNKSKQEELTFASEKFGSFSFLAGFFYYNDRGTSGANVNFPLGPNGEILNDQPGGFFNAGLIKTTAVAGFGEANLDVSDSLHLIGGIRYSWEKKRSSVSTLAGAPALTGDSWNAWTPRFSIRYDLSSHANVYATYSKGFKSGVLPGSSIVTSAKPETLTSYEVGAKIGTPTMSVNMSAFYYDYKDLQFQTFNGTTASLTNASNAKIYGFEIDGNAKLTDDLSIRLAGSWVPYAKYKNFLTGNDNVFLNDPRANPDPNDPNAIAQPDCAAAGASLTGPAIGPYGMCTAIFDGSGFRVLKTPKFTGNATLTYERETSIGTVDASATLYYSGGYNWNLSGRVHTGSYATVNARVGIVPAGSKFHFTVWGKNLGNEGHISGVVLSENADEGLTTPPRQIGITVDYAF